MSEIETVGPAFPLSTVNPFERSVTTCDGMTLRDYFAAKALAAYAANQDINVAIRDGRITIDDAATACHEWADAMLKAREAK